MTNNNGHSNGNGHSSALTAALPIPELIRIGRETKELLKVEEFARAMARSIKNEPYDPNKHPDDKLKEEKFLKDSEDLKDAEEAAAHALTNVKDGERRAAEVQRGLQEPKLPAKIVVTAIGVIAISLGLTIHDVFFSHMEDQFWAWVFAMGGGIVIGALVTWAVGGIHDPAGQRSGTNLAGLIGGLGVGIAGFLLRLQGGDFVIGLALTLLEFAAVALVELYAAPLRDRYRQYLVARENHHQTAAVVTSLKDEAARRTQQRDEIHDRVEQFKGYVAFRTFCHQKFPEIEEAAVQIATQAFYEKQEEERREQLRQAEQQRRHRLGLPIMEKSL